MFAVADVVRPESKEAVRALHDRDVEVVMMMEDARPVAEAVAAELGIDSVFAEVLPEQKASKKSSNAAESAWRWSVTA